MKLLVTYHPDFSSGGYDPLAERVAPAFGHLRRSGMLDRPGVEVLEPEPAPIDLVRRVHTDSHLDDVGRSGYLDVSLLSTGGVVRASEMVVRGEADNAFCFVGAAGHHAGREGFWGFCFINDVGVAATNLLDGGLASRLAVIDIDPHFGDGTRDILGPEARVLHLNFHSSYGRTGLDAGASNVDIALPHDAGDEEFMDHARGAIARADDFEPELLFIIFGYDSHERDYGAFRLSDDFYREFAEAVRAAFPTRVCYVLSGGAEVDIGITAISSVIDVLSSIGVKP